MWEQIRANRRRSFLLIIAIALLLAVMGWASGELVLGPGYGIAGVPLALIVLGIQLLVYRFAAGPVLLHGTNARELEREDSPRLFNIVEEMRLASGLQHMPRIYLIDDPAPNAFALGRRLEDSAIAVTSGLLYRLNRDELQGVIAHEVAHINNRDVQFMTLAGVLIGSIVILSDLVWNSMRFGLRGRSRNSSRDNEGAHILLMVVALLVALLSPIFAQILYYTTSRKREYLADACGAQYTRYPEGLASALEKISGCGLSLASRNRAMAAMCIVNPGYAAAAAEPASVFSTHPPTSERVRILRSMGGAGFGAYEAAFAGIKGRGVIGSRTLADAPTVEARAASGEGPIESRHDSRGIALRRSGYVEVPCGCCGAVMSIAPTFTADRIVCIRCGSQAPVPVAGEYGTAEPAEGRTAGAPMRPGTDDGSLHYTRTGSGWETFRCACGGTIQLSPTFSAPQTSCPRCRRKVTITHHATV